MNNIIIRKDIKYPVQNNGVKTKSCSYPMNDLKSVFIHYDKKLGRNVQTPNTLKNK